MKLTQIATLLNTVLVPNVFGKGEDGSHNPITIAEDLRNVVDLGTALSDMDADTLKNYAKDLAVGIFNIYVDTRTYKDETYDLFLSEQDYGGAIARIRPDKKGMEHVDYRTHAFFIRPDSGAGSNGYRPLKLTKQVIDLSSQLCYL